MFRAPSALQHCRVRPSIQIIPTTKVRLDVYDVDSDPPSLLYCSQQHTFNYLCTFRDVQIAYLILWESGFQIFDFLLYWLSVGPRFIYFAGTKLHSHKRPTFYWNNLIVALRSENKSHVMVHYQIIPYRLIILIVLRSSMKLK